MGLTFVKNAASNIVRGGATAMVAIVLPHFLTKSLDAERFAAWSLMLQIAAYANYLDFGLQTSVARSIAQATEREDYTGRDRVVSTSLALLLIAAMVALSIIAMLVCSMPLLVPKCPPALLFELRFAVLVLAGSTAISLPFSAFSGVLIGVHKNEYPALAIGGSRILGAVSIVLMTHYSHSLVALASCFAITNLLGSLLLVGFARKLVPLMQVSRRFITRQTIRELLVSGVGLTAWSLSGLLVTGLDLTVLGYLRFSEVGFYAIGASLVTFIAGFNGAATSALMAPLAALHAKVSLRKIQEITLRATNLVTYLNLILTVIVFLCGHLLLRLWVGAAYARGATTILEILTVACTIRLIGGPFASMLIATGQQRQGIAQGVAEGISNLISSILLGRWLGAVGVALGTLIGALCGIAWTCVLTMAWAKEAPISRRGFFLQCIARPLVATFPLFVFTYFAGKMSVTTTFACLLALSCGLSYLLAKSFGGLSLGQPLMPGDSQKG